MIEGTVQQITSQPRGKYGNLAYSVKMDDGVWYGHGFDQPIFGEGDYISFQEQYNGKYANVVTNTVQVLDGGNAPQQQPRQQQRRPQQGGGQPNRQQRQQAGAARQASGGAGGGRDQYWENKEKRDIVVQRQIQHQASRNAAIELIKVAVSADALALPTKKADKLDALVALVNELTDQFSADTDAAGSGKSRSAQDLRDHAQADHAEQDSSEDFNDDIPF